MDKIFVSHLTCAATFPMSTQVSQLCSSELQLSHSLTFLLLLHPPRLLHPQDESDQGVKGKLGSRRTCAQKGNLVLFSALLTVRSPTLLKLNAKLRASHSIAGMLGCPGYSSFLKHILSPLFPFYFPPLQILFTSLSLGTNFPQL